MNRKNFLLIPLLLLAPITAGAHEGWGILLDSRGRVYFTDIPSGTIWRISEGGQLEKVVANKHSHALHMDAAGNLYGTNPHLTLPVGSIWKLAPDGRISHVVAPTKDFPLGLQSFAMDTEGSAYSVNARGAATPLLVMLKRRADGTIERLAGGEPGHADGKGDAASFIGIDGMAWGNDGALYVADGPYVRRVSLDGTVTTPIARPLTRSSWDEDLMGIAVESSGAILIADYAGRRIARIRDTTVTQVRSTGWLWAPTGVTERDGNIYAIEHLRLPLAILGDLKVGPYLRIERISKDGRAETLATLWGSNTWLVVGVLVLIVALFAGIRSVLRLRIKGSPSLSSGWRREGPRWP